VPVVKRRKHVEEEEAYHEISNSEEESAEEEEVYEEEEEEENEEVQYEGESDGVSNDETELPSTSKSVKEHALDSKKTATKRKNPSKKPTPSTPTKKIKYTVEKPAQEKRIEKRIVKVAKRTVVRGKEKAVVDETKKSGPSMIEYNDKNVDFNLYNEAPEHIKNVKVLLTSNVIMSSRMIEASGNSSQGLTYDYAALSFVRQSKNLRAYEFNLPLTLAPSIIKGINFLIKSNPKFFEKQIKFVQEAIEESNN
jgi:hypothetical protein